MKLSILNWVGVAICRLVPFVLFLGGGFEAHGLLAQERKMEQAEAFQPAVLLEVQQVLPSAAAVKDELLQLRLKCRAWDLLWPYHTTEARSALRELADQVAGEGFPRELRAKGRSEILAVLFRRDPDEAWKMNGRAAEDLKKGGAGLGGGLGGSLNALAGDLLESSPEAAAAILKESLPADPSRDALSSLWKLREINPSLAESVADNILKIVPRLSGPRGISLANSLASYFFPEGAATETSLSSSIFFRSALQLIQVASEAPPALMSEAIQRSLLLNMLEAMAPRLAPDSIPELQGLSARLSGMIPPAATDGNTLAAAGAIKGMLEHDDERAMKEAMKLDDSPMREKLLEQLRLRKVQEDLRRKDFEMAYEDAGQLSNPTSRLDSLTRIAKASEQNPGWVTDACIDAIRQTIQNSEPELPAAFRAVAGLYGIDPDAGSELNLLAIARLNSRLNTKMPIEELRGKELEAVIRNAFAAAARHSRGALKAATAINDSYLSLTARLAVLEAQLK